MDDITLSFYTTLAGSSVVVADLGMYGGVSAICTTKRVPAAMPRPYVWTYGEVTNERYGSKDLRGREILRDVWVVDDDEGSEERVERLAENVQRLFDGAVLNMGSGVTNWLCQVSGPVIGPTEPDSKLTARIVTVRAIYQGD
jgi:hypothetical protein